MTHDWTDEEIVATLQRFKRFTTYREIGAVMGPNFKTVHNVAKGNDFTVDTRIALIALFKELGIGPDSSADELMEAGHKLRTHAVTIRSRLSGERRVENGEDFRRGQMKDRNNDEEGEGTHG